MKKIFPKLFIVLLLSMSLAGCGKADMVGIILEVTENEVLLSRNLTSDEYKKIENESAIKLQNEDVRGERASLDLIELTYDNTDELRKGDEVEVWIDGDILESYPSQAKTKKLQSRILKIIRQITNNKEISPK